MVGLSNKDIAGVFRDIETLMKVVGEDKRRAQTYGRAAWMIEKLPDSAVDLAAAGRLTDVRGIGSSVEKVVMELLATGASTLREDLAARTTPAVLEMLRIPGLGPKKLHTIVQELAVNDLASLRAAAADGRIAGLTGFGPKMARNILDGLEFLDATRGRVRIDHAAALAGVIIEKLGLEGAQNAGALRRREPIVGTLAIVALGDAGGVEIPGATRDGDTWVLPRGTDPEIRIRFADDAGFAHALFEETGPADHVSAVLAKPGQDASEEEIYTSRGLHFVPPERRHACDGTSPIPALVERSDLRGMLHVHTTWSDGKRTIAEMAEAARERGYSYLGVTDHSRSAIYANGLTIDRLQLQAAEIRGYNESAPDGFRVLHGTEADILPDGQMDFPDEVLAELDFVIASVHSSFTQPPEVVTDRIVRAVSNPHVDILGHSTGRLLLRRDGYAVDVERVLAAAAEHNTMVELNASPWRLDLAPEHHARARELGIGVPIQPDAHDTPGMDDNDWGIGAARHGGLTADDVPNTLDVDAFLERCRA
ncbi:MAG: helix-hairpin-helix domain-containing protein [Planctomycetota bacterium]